VPRSIFIGDVHSCADELEELLGRVAATRDDAVFFVGDLVSRGPDPAGVLRLFRSAAAKSVVGNHEQRLLHARAARASGAPMPKLGASHLALLESLTDEDWALIEELPLFLHAPEHAVLVVHAGIDEKVPLDEQDPWLVTHIRSIDDGKPSERWGTPWGASYVGPPHVVFGHNAQKGVQLHPSATGIDTACVYGGALTALVLPKGSEPPPVGDRVDALVSVKARKEYVPYGHKMA